MSEALITKCPNCQHPGGYKTDPEPCTYEIEFEVHVMGKAQHETMTTKCGCRHIAHFSTIIYEIQQ